MSKITRFLLRYAVGVLLIGLALGVFGAYYSVRLFSNLKTDIEELLPTDARSVVDLAEVRSRLESTNSLNVVILSDHVEASKRFVDDLAAEVLKLPKSVSAGIEYRIDQELNFFNQRKSLFISLADLNQIHHFIGARIQYETSLYNPLTIFQEKNTPEPRLDFKALQSKYTSRVDSYSRFPDGYYATADQKIRVLIVNLPGTASGMDGGKKLRDSVDEIVAKLNPKSYAPDLAVHFTGGVQDMLEEHDALVEDLALSTVVVSVLVMMAMLIYFRSVVATAALLTALVLGTLLTFGISYFLIGYLNANSAFMGSIVLGNGINFGIIMLARYMEERRKNKGTPRAVAIAVDKTVHATLIAALAAALSYGSLMLTSFRGFRQFGVIGFTGMVICWIFSYTVLPALLILFYRIGLLRKRVKTPKPYLTHLIATCVRKFPKTILGFTFTLCVLSVMGFSNLNSSIIETDFTKLRNKHSAENGSIFWGKYVDQVFQRYLSPVVILPKKQADVNLIADELRKTKAAEGASGFIVNVSTIDDFVPADQKKKIAVLRDMRRMLPQKLLVRMDPGEQRMAKDLLSEESFKPFEEKDLPELVKSKFREKDGTIGKLVLVEPSLSPELSKSDNLINFVHSVRAAADRIEPGAAVAGTLPITSDMFESIVKDGPKATLFAFLAVFLLIVLLFRNVVTIAQCSFALLMGVLWMLGFILDFHEKINFLNFVALPITFGIGVDYGVNIFQRYRQEKNKGIIPIIEHTGGAVMLASFTTVTGYGSLLIASNQAFVSFGKLAILGEFSCVFAALVSLPALIWYISEKKRTHHENASKTEVRSESLV
jgi:predicted RND superfamily exporter protein